MAGVCSWRTIIGSRLTKQLKYIRLGGESKCFSRKPNNIFILVNAIGRFWCPDSWHLGGDVCISYAEPAKTVPILWGSWEIFIDVQHEIIEFTLWNASGLICRIAELFTESVGIDWKRLSMMLFLMNLSWKSSPSFLKTTENRTIRVNYQSGLKPVSIKGLLKCETWVM